VTTVKVVRGTVVAQFETGSECAIAAGKQQVLRSAQDDNFQFGRDDDGIKPLLGTSHTGTV